ncbi:MAG TPA: sigma 54-interacting transcriptional regulator [Candidatus Binatia bacterium]|nr:sigma 54-interacting transcriptional regulator [Candidatus Binatia bacterium]
MMNPLPFHNLNVDAALRTILEGTATETGERFFAALVKNLSDALNTHGAWVTEYIEEYRRLRALAFWMGGEWIHGWEMNIDGTPCAEVIHQRCLIHFPDNLLGLFPADSDIQAIGAVSYMGMPLIDLDGKVLGHLAVLDTRPMPKEPTAQALFQIFAARAAAEMRRLRAEKQVREREEKLGRLVNSAMDAIIELNRNLNVTRVNAAAEKVFGCSSQDIIGELFTRFLSSDSRERLANLIIDLDLRPEGERYTWIPGGLNAQSASGEAFPAEATISRFDMGREPFYTLILRNVNARLQARQKIRSLTVEAEYLREEIKELRSFDEIVGSSEPLARVLRDIGEVAGTDANVLILGETGTGKELIARAIHRNSRRREKPLIKVNCAAMPGTLIESELFGYEQGAFTGATKKREGRFALADGGTIFLDEIGELPVELQVKLLRVLQEGEFEPVGSSRTQKVDARVIAATNRDLKQATREGKFREDLYYRLNVFPIELPPLRERGDDIGLLAENFARRFAQRMGRAIESLSEDCIRRLRSYGWPGNVRELQNVIERAVITSRDGRLNLDRALPETGKLTTTDALSSENTARRVRTAKELEELERCNLIAALEATNWRVAGTGGAAQLLGMKPTTLSSRMKALGLERKR